MHVHVTESKEAKEFLKSLGVKIDKSSAHNAITLVAKDGSKLTLWSEIDSGIAAGIPGIYVDEEK